MVVLRINRKSFDCGLCRKSGARVMLLYSTGCVCPGSTLPNFMNGDSSVMSSTNASPSSARGMWSSLLSFFR